MHKLPAKQYRKIPEGINHIWCIGLTASLCREALDDFTILRRVGPTLFNINLKELVSLQVISKVQVIQILAPLPKAFQLVLNESKDEDFKELLILLNPYKYCLMMSLIQELEVRQKQKFLVMFNELQHMKLFSKAANKPYACHHTEKRNTIVDSFRSKNTAASLLVNRIADVGLDIPDLAFSLQIGRFGKSRQQEMQRLGRIQRYKKDGRPSLFYNVVTNDPFSTEM